MFKLVIVIVVALTLSMGSAQAQSPDAQQMGKGLQSAVPGSPQDQIRLQILEKLAALDKKLDRMYAVLAVLWCVYPQEERSKIIKGFELVALGDIHCPGDTLFGIRSGRE